MEILILYLQKSWWAFTLLDLWTHFSLTIFGLEIDYSMRNADLANHKIKFFKNRQKFFFQKFAKKKRMCKKNRIVMGGLRPRNLPFFEIQHSLSPNFAKRNLAIFSENRSLFAKIRLRNSRVFGEITSFFAIFRCF